jgi:NAD(P)-dependent dehydrogenase (short-subunit alcohol dehydrogenase family)
LSRRDIRALADAMAEDGLSVWLVDARGHRVEDVADLVPELERLTMELEDARESLRVERENAGRALAQLRDLTSHADHRFRPAYQHAVDVVERGGR